MKLPSINKIAYTALAVAVLWVLSPNYAKAQENKDEGLSFYEHVDSNNNGKVDDGETSKLARIVFEEGENIAIDSKFKSGTGNLYVVSEKGEIVKTIPQQYDTGVKTSQLLQDLPTGDYTTVFSEDNSGDLNGSYVKVVSKGSPLTEGVSRAVLDSKGDKLLQRKNYIVACDGWNDFNGDKLPQRWEVTNPRIAPGSVFYDGQSATFLTRHGVYSNVNVILTKRKDKSFEKFKFQEKKTRGRTVAIKTPKLTSGDFLLRIGQAQVKFEAQ